MTRCENCERVKWEHAVGVGRFCWGPEDFRCWRARTERLQAERDAIRTQARAEAIAECVAWLRERAGEADDDGYVGESAILNGAAENLKREVRP